MIWTQNKLISVNFHFWPYCNFNCRYCFARFNEVSSTLSKKDCFKIVGALQNNGTEKINFAGGEPTLSPFLGDLIVYSKSLGLTTSVISNGTGITERFLRKYGNSLDWIGLSLDSGDELIQYQLGRGNGTYVQDIINQCEMIRKAGIKLKINSVMTRLNYKEDMSWLLEKINPDRWKVFQVLKIEGRNCHSIKELLMSQEEFEFFVKRHENLSPISENNDNMIDSYVMIDPQGRFCQNNGNIYVFSHPILEVGIINALNEVNYNYAKFLERGGLYVW